MSGRRVRMRRPQYGHLVADLLIRCPQLGQYFFSFSLTAPLVGSWG